MRCFVAEVRWLFPVNRQRKRKPTKQRNTEPSLELNQNTGLLNYVLRAHRLNSKNLFCSCFNGAGYLFILFPFMVEIFVCFPSRTSFPFKVSRYTCGYGLIGFLHMLYLNHHIIYLISFSHHIIYLCTFRLSSIFLLQ